MKLLKRKKSFLLVLVVFVSFLLMFSQTAFAEDGVKLSASTESGAVGEQVTVTINIANAMDTEGGQFDLSFDDEILEPVSAARGNFVPDVSGNIFDANLELEDGKIRVIWVIAAGSELDEGVVGTIVFKLLDDGETNLTFSGLVLAPEGVESETPTSGKVTALDAEALKQAAIDAANKAIADLPDPEDITLDDEAAVLAARALVKVAKDDHGAVDSDFDNLAKLVSAEAMIAKLKAIKAACDAILALPTVDQLKLDDKPDVVAARALVNKAKDDHGAVDADFADCLPKLIAAENRIRELEGLVPTPPTGGLNYLLFPGLFVMGVGMLLYTKRKRFAVR